MHREPFCKGLFDGICDFIIFGVGGFFLAYTASWIFDEVHENRDQINELSYRLKECEKKHELKE